MKLDKYLMAIQVRLVQILMPLKHGIQQKGTTKLSLL